jgi:hypothetical protein
MNIAVGLCVLDNIKPATIFGLFNLMPAIKGVFCSTGCLLPFNRNQLIHNLFESLDNYSHILFIDSDTCGFNIQTLQSLYNSDKDIISPIMVSRNPPFNPIHSYLPDGDCKNHQQFFERLSRKDSKGCIKVRSTGMAFTLIKCEIFKKVSSPWFHHDRRPRISFIEERQSFINSVKGKEIEEIEEIEEIIDKSINLGRTCHKGTSVIGEDVAFCDEARRFGYETWINCDYYISHIGETKFNIRDTVSFLNDPTLKSRMEQLTYVWEK